MNGCVRCQFCNKEIKIPDNLQGAKLECPFCTRYSEVFPAEPGAKGHATRPASDAAEQVAAPNQASVPGAQIDACVVEFIALRKAKTYAGNIGFYASIAAGAVVTISMGRPHYLYTPVALFLLCMIFISLVATLLNSYFASAVARVFARYFPDSGIQGPEKPEIYRQLLSEFSKKLAVTEEEVVADPFLRGILLRLDNSGA